MERLPKHLEQDSRLRAEFIEQTSWDEWAAVHAPFVLHPDGKRIIEEHLQSVGLDATYEDALSAAIAAWEHELDPETNIDEVYYLQGLGYAQRQQMLEQQRTELEAMVSKLGLLDDTNTIASQQV